MKNTDLYIVFPEWAVWLVVVGLFIGFLSNLAEIYIIYLKRKIEENKL